MSDLIETHDPVPDCDCRNCACRERDRLREVLHRIAEHHEEQRDAWRDEDGDADQARYHEVRRKDKKMSKEMEIFREAFGMPRDKRSKEYQNGVLDVLRFRLGEVTDVRCCYEIGTAAADAYFAGCDEGHRRAREYLEKVGAGRTAPEGHNNALEGAATARKP